MSEEKNTTVEAITLNLKFKADQEQINLLCAYLNNLALNEKTILLREINAAKKSKQKVMIEEIDFKVAIKALDTVILSCEQKEIKIAATEVRNEAVKLALNPEAKTNFSKLAEFVRETTKVVEGDLKAIATYQKKINDFKENGPRNARICRRADNLLLVASIISTIAGIILLGAVTGGAALLGVGLLFIVSPITAFGSQEFSKRDKHHKPVLTAGDKLFALFASPKKDTPATPIIAQAPQLGTVAG